jgi:hypothetical protein
MLTLPGGFVLRPTQILIAKKDAGIVQKDAWADCAACKRCF